MLGTLDPSKKGDWKAHVSPLLHAYNCTGHVSTGESPFFLMFGRHPRLPLDLAFGLNQSTGSAKSCTSYVQAMKDRLAESYKVAMEAADKARLRQKGRHDLRVRGATICSGDGVLVCQLAFDGKHKLADKWETDVYVVLKQPNANIPVFLLENEDGGGRRRTIHRNHLLPIGSLWSKSDTVPVPIPRPRKTVNRSIKAPEIEADVQPDEASDAGDGYFMLEVESVLQPNYAREPSVFTVSSNSDLQSEESPCAEEPTNLVPTDGREVGVDQQGVPVDVATADASQDVVENAEISWDPRTIPSEPLPEAGTVASAPRRPTRSRKPPALVTSDKYCLSQTISDGNADWQKRAAFLRSLAESGLLASLPEDAYRAMLSLVTGT